MVFDSIFNYIIIISKWVVEHDFINSHKILHSKTHTHTRVRHTFHFHCGWAWHCMWYVAGSRQTHKRSFIFVCSFYHHAKKMNRKKKTISGCKISVRKWSHIVLYDAPNFYVRYLRYKPSQRLQCNRNAKRMLDKHGAVFTVVSNDCLSANVRIFIRFFFAQSSTYTHIRRQQTKSACLHCFYIAS